MIDLLKDLAAIEDDLFFRFISTIGMAIGFTWTVYWTIKKSRKEKAEKQAERVFAIDKMRAEHEHEIKKQRETEREEFMMLLGKLQNRWDKHDNYQSRDRFEIKKIMDQHVTKIGGANIVKFCECKNGGDHIVSSKNYTVSVLMDSVNYSKDIQSDKDNWQNVKVDGQMHEFFFKALINDYNYIPDYTTNLEEGDFKSQIKKKYGHHIAAFYIGRIDLRHFYLMFQFGEFDMKNKGDLLTIRNQCNKIFAMMKKSHGYKQQTELLQEVITRKKLNLIDKGLIDDKFITDYEGYMNKEIDNLNDV